MYDELTQRGYWVTPQVRVGNRRIDMVVEGHNDARLAVECDGDKHHGPDKWADDMQRERELWRAGGWVFWRCFYSAFIRRRKELLDDLLRTLAERGIEPTGAEGAPRSVHVEHRVAPLVTEPVSPSGLMPVENPESARASTPAVLPAPPSSARGEVPPVEAPLYPLTEDGGRFDGERSPWVRTRDADLPFSGYVAYAGPAGNDPRSVSLDLVSEGLVRIIEVEGPVVAKRAYDIYLRSSGIKRMRHKLKSTMNKALALTFREGRVVSEDEAAKGGSLFSIVRLTGSPPIRLRSRGPRSFEEIPPSELQVVARYLVERHGFVPGSDEHLRAVLECFDLKRLTTQVGTTLLEILDRSFPYVDEFLSGMHK
jgi:very-short-patch-repair endonuclease